MNDYLSEICGITIQLASIAQKLKANSLTIKKEDLERYSKIVGGLVTLLAAGQYTFDELKKKSLLIPNK